MRLSRHERLIRRSLTTYNGRCLSCCIRALQPGADPRSQLKRRHLSTTASLREEGGRDVAVLGGGITGLASAYYLAKADPKAKITLYEASQRLGGWLQSKHVDVDGGRVLFESGPRTLRARGNGLVTAKLIEDLGLEDDLLFVSKSSPAARNRYIYWPDHLIKLPAPGEGIIGRIVNILRNSEFYTGVVVAAWRDLVGTLTGAVRPKDGDESIGDFISRRGTKEAADNMASAVFHGIYAGDIYNLSVRSLMPEVAYLESKYGGVIWGYKALDSNNRRIMQKSLLDISNNPDLSSVSHDLRVKMMQCSVFTLLGGLGQLVSRLEEALTEMGVTIKRSAPIKHLHRAPESKDQSRPITVSLLDGQETSTHDTVISTLPYNTLNKLISQADEEPQGFRQPAVDVMVVNLFFSDPKLLAANPGFGYLIPRSVPFSQNPEFALGVIFDTFAAPGQDTATGTKVTVMLGGHWWKGSAALPSEEEGMWMARSVLARHLRIADEPAAWQARLQRQCIPQYVVGHRRRMSDFRDRLLRDFGGRLKVAGCSYGGVGVNDCVRAAFDLAAEVKEKGWTTTTTGLEGFTRETVDIVELHAISIPIRGVRA